MPIARSLKETWRYTLPDDEAGTVFTLGPVTQPAIESKVADLIAQERVFEAYDALLSAGGLRGWDRFLDGKGNEVLFQGKGRPTAEDLSRLSSMDRVRLGAEVWKRCNLDPEDSD